MPWTDAWRRSGATFDVPAKTQRLEALNQQISEESFWAVPDRAQVVLKEKAQIERDLQRLEQPSRALADTRELLDLARRDADESLLPELARGLDEAESQVGGMEFNRMFSGKNDRSNAFVSINAGSGGTESQDWAEMLLRMYTRWCDRKGFETEIVDFLAGEANGAGVKSVTVHVRGEFVYGHLRAEVGVHRLVRISPFDAAARRHTSFASVFATPEIDDEVEVVIDEKDLRIDTYRASGAGGQHVNKTDSAVRITHLPSGVVVACQNERSQHKNRSIAMKILRSRLYELELEKRAAEVNQLHASKKEIGFGSQIRSYVLHPYRMVKDHRTDVERGDADRVLDGDLDRFIHAYLLRGDAARAA